MVVPQRFSNHMGDTCDESAHSSSGTGSPIIIRADPVLVITAIKKHRHHASSHYDSSWWCLCWFNAGIPWLLRFRTDSQWLFLIQASRIEESRINGIYSPRCLASSRVVQMIELCSMQPMTQPRTHQQPRLQGTGPQIRSCTDSQLQVVDGCSATNVNTLLGTWNQKNQD